MSATTVPPGLTAFQFRMPAGFPGTVDRTQAAVIEAGEVSPTTPPTIYGGPLVIDAVATAAGTPSFRGVTGAGDGVLTYGLLTRPFPTQGGWADPLGVSVPPTRGQINVMKAGYIHVALQGPSAAIKGAPVFVRVSGGTPTQPVGGLEAGTGVGGTTPPAGTEAIPTAYWMGPADGLGNSAVRINLP